MFITYSRLQLALLALCAALPAIGSGVTECKPVAIQRLSDADIKRIVLDEISTLTRVSVAELDMTKPLKSIDRTENGPMTYGFFLLHIEDRLSIRLSSASDEVAAKMGVETARDAYERFSLDALLALVPSALHNTPDCKP